MLTGGLQHACKEHRAVDRVARHGQQSSTRTAQTTFVRLVSDLIADKFEDSLWIVTKRFRINGRFNMR